MKTETTTQELKVPKPGFGNRLTLLTKKLCIVLVLALLGLKASAQCPSADFFYVTHCGTTTIFSDTSTISGGSIVSWNWLFGDGTSSTVRSPSHLYASTGTYTVSLVVTSNTGCSDSAIRVIQYNSSCSNGYKITSPINGATINNRCDLHFCVNDSLGNSHPGFDWVWIDSDINGNYNAGLALGQQSSIMGIPNNFCLNNNGSSLNLTPGTHTFYLHSVAWNNSLDDSVTVTVANTISNLCNTLTYGDSVDSPGGNYVFFAYGLNPTETYTLQLFDNNGYPIDSSVTVSNTSIGIMLHHYPHNGSFSQTLRVTACDGEVCSNNTTVTVTNSTCTAYTSILDTMFQYPYNFCLGGFTGATGVIAYGGLSANGTSSVIINWGDGTINTYPVSHNGNTDSAFLFFNQAHTYLAPGVYSTKLVFYDAAACYNDSIIGSINVSGNACGNLTGIVYEDANNNCSQDMGEVGIGGIEVSVTQGSNVYFSWTDAFGNYGFNNLPTGAYTIQIDNINPGYAVTCSNSLPHSTNVTSSPTVENFAVGCSGSFDVAVTGISLMSGFYPGTFDAVLPHVGILNAACNLTIPGQVKMILTPCIQYTTGGNFPWFTNPPTAIIHASTGDTLVWNVSDINNIGTFSYWDYAVNIATCTSAHVGDTACITMMVLPTNGDVDLSNNTFTRCFEIGVAYDPNFKEVEPKGEGAQGLIPANTTDLTYTINFQNTGTAVARNIYVLDSIDTDLNINSIEILSASHGMQIYRLANRVMKFMFANIMLPDSTQDKAHSHAYITYRIKPNTGLAMGTQIKNTAHIYFDYNEAVATNTTLNTIQGTTGINELNKSGLLKVYPNPAKDKLIVSINNSNGNSVITITDVIGKTVKQIKTNELQTEINVSDLQDGIYFVRLAQNNDNYVEKVVISK